MRTSIVSVAQLFLVPIVTVLISVPVQAQSENQNKRLDDLLLLGSPTTIAADAELTEHMTTLAERAVDDHCAACHGNDLQGQIGIPNLVDYDWLWGVTGMEVTSLEATLEIMQTIMYGVRDVDCAEESMRYGACPDTRFSQMPAYGELIFSEQEVNDLTQYVLDMSGNDADIEAVARAEELWPICVECHGDSGYGYKPYGGPDLTDSIWLYGNTAEQIYDVIYSGRTGYCPAWAHTLDPVSIKALAVYLYNKSTGY